MHYIYVYIYICVFVCVCVCVCVCICGCCALDGMENKLYKMHGTYSYIKIHNPLKFTMWVT